MSNPDDAQINDYLNTEAFPLNPKKFVVLTTRRHPSLPYAGYYSLGGNRGFFGVDYITSLFLVSHEIGHGLGLQQ
jgi:hypothetical protein